MKPSQLFSMNTLLHVLCVFVWWIYLQELSMESHHLNLKQILIFFLSCDAPFSLFLSLSLSLSLSHTHTHTHTYTYALASLIICEYTNIFCRCTRRRNTKKSMICTKSYWIYYCSCSSRRWLLCGRHNSERCCHNYSRMCHFVFLSFG